MTDQFSQQAVAAQDEGGPEEFARQRPYRALVTQWLRDELGSVEADNVGKLEFLRYVRLAERAAYQQQMPSEVRDAILYALTAGGHQITADEVRLFSDPGKRTSALSQVCDRLEAVWAQRGASRATGEPS